MKFARKIFDNAHHKMEANEKTKKFWPLIDAFDTLLFTPNTVTKSGAHIRDAIDLKRTMMLVITAMVPCLLFGIFNTGYQHYAAQGAEVLAETSWFTMALWGLAVVGPLIVVSYGVGLGIEFIFAIRNQHSVAEGFLVSGMLIPLIMPAQAPLWQVGLSTAFAVLIGKEVFGGTGMNVLNVALTARAFFFFAFPNSIIGDKVWIAWQDQITFAPGRSGATALGELAGDTPVFENVDAFAAKYSFFDSFIGLIPGSVGETSALACLLGAGLLLATGIASWKVMVSFFGGGIFVATILHLIGGHIFHDVNPLHQLMLGGFMFGMVFMVTDPVTAAQTSVGKYIYGFLAGSLAILIRIGNPAYPEGVMLAILIANVCAPLIDHMVVRANINKRLNRAKVKAEKAKAKAAKLAAAAETVNAETH